MSRTRNHLVHVGTQRHVGAMPLAMPACGPARGLWLLPPPPFPLLPPFPSPSPPPSPAPLLSTPLCLFLLLWLAIGTVIFRLAQRQVENFHGVQGAGTPPVLLARAIFFYHVIWLFMLMTVMSMGFIDVQNDAYSTRTERRKGGSTLHMHRNFGHLRTH